MLPLLICAVSFHFHLPPPKDCHITSPAGGKHSISGDFDRAGRWTNACPSKNRNERHSNPVTVQCLTCNNIVWDMCGGERFLLAAVPFQTFSESNTFFFSFEFVGQSRNVFGEFGSATVGLSWHVHYWNFSSALFAVFSCLIALFALKVRISCDLQVLSVS